MNGIQEKLKRMVVFEADKKHKKIMKTIPKTNFEYSSWSEIDAKFNSMSQSYASQMVKFELKSPMSSSIVAELPDQSEIARRAYFTDNPHLSSIPFKRMSKILTGSSSANNGIQSPTSAGILSRKPSRAAIPDSPSSQKQTRKLITSVGDLKTASTLREFQSKNSFSSSHSLKQLGLNPKKKQDESKYFTPRKQQSFSDLHEGQTHIRFATKRNSLAFEIPQPSIQPFQGTKQEKQQEQQQKQQQQQQNSKTRVSIIQEFNDVEEKLSKQPEWALIQKRLQQAINNKKKEDNPNDPVSPVIQLFGNNFIAMVMQALVVKKIDDLYGVKLNTDSNIPISENLLRNFGINLQLLNQIPSVAERNAYIADTMALRISVMIKDWDHKQTKRENHLQERMDQLKKENDRKSKNQSDMFDWLKIGSNHDQLQKKLRIAIIEKLTDFENQEEIIRIKQNPHGQKIQLKQLPYVSTKVLLLLMDEKQNRYLKETFTQEEQEQFNMYQQSGISSSTPKIQDSPSIPQNSKIKTNFENDDEDDDVKLPEWSEELEAEFLRNKKLARVIYSQDISVSSWDKQGYIPLVQEYNIQNKKVMAREKLMENYRNGCWLTEKELKFIADTSALMNKCIDKNYVKKLTSKLNPEDVSHLELALAENIINNYENMQNLIRGQRLKFLKSRQIESLKLRRKQQQISEAKQEREENLKIQRKYAKMFRRIGERLFKSKEQNQKLEKIDNKAAPNQEIDPKQQKLQEMLLRQSDTMKTLSKSLHSKKGFNFHSMHPPSKLPYYSCEDESGQNADGLSQVNPKRIEQMDKMIRSYQLTLKSKPEVRIQTNFAKFYTGGPRIEEGSSQFNIKERLKLTKKQLAGIIKMQTLFRLNRILKQKELLKIEQENLKQERRNRILQSKSINSSDLKRDQNLYQEQSSGFSESLYSSSDEEKNYKNILSTTEMTKLKKESQKPKENLQINIKNISPKQSLSPSPTLTLHQTKSKQLISPVKGENNHFHLISSHRVPLTSPNSASVNFSNTFGAQEDANTTISPSKPDKEQPQNLDSSIKSNPITETSDSFIENQAEVQKLENNESQQLKLEQQQNFIKGLKKSRGRIGFLQSTDEGKKPISSTIIRSALPPSQLVEILNKQAHRSKKGLLLKHQKLLSAAKMNKIAMIQNSGFNILEEDVNIQDQEQNTALYYCIQNQNVIFVRWLLSKKADVNIRCSNRNTPMHLAFQVNNEEILHDLMCMNPDLNLVNNDELTPLAFASLEMLNRFNLQTAIVQKTLKEDYDDASNYLSVVSINNNNLFNNPKKPIKVIGKVKLQNFYPLKQPTIQISNYSSI